MAYKYVAFAVLLAEANFNTEKLSLPVPRPIKENQVSYNYIAPPNIKGFGAFMGRIDAGGYIFSEAGDWHRRSVVKIDALRGKPTAERNEVLSQQKSVIASNEAYQVAVSWLRAIDVDVPELERTNRVQVRQRSFRSTHHAGEQVPLPYFDVRWGDWERSKVEVVVNGSIKELVEISQHDSSYSRRPTELIRNVDELLAIPDEEFAKYSSIERSNLVARFAVNLNLSPNLPSPTPTKHLAYKHVGLAALVQEANFNAERLNLPIQRPITENGLTFKSIIEPDIYRFFGGRVDAGGYSFCERDRSRARLVSKEHPFGKKPGELFRSEPLITTNEAYQLAVGWLKAIDVDVRALEKTNKVEVQQQVWSGREEVLSPIFEVRWGGWDEPKVAVIINGKEKKLTFLKQYDISFSRRPAELIKNGGELLAISDEEFQNYSALERSNLVARFAANWSVSSWVTGSNSVVAPSTNSPPVK